jgi:hypothetical protein
MTALLTLERAQPREVFTAAGFVDYYLLFLGVFAGALYLVDFGG